MNAETLKKHHFWLVAVAAPLLSLLTIVMVRSSVGGEYESELNKVNGVKGGKGITPCGVKAIKDYKEQSILLVQVRSLMWKINYEKQKPLFSWPESPLLPLMEKANEEFGKELKEVDRELSGGKKNQFIIEQAFRRDGNDCISKAYQSLVKEIQPTQFPDKSKVPNALRCVRDWDNKIPTTEQLWLALEDFWIQRAMLQAVKTVNEEASLFHKVYPPAKPGKKEVINRNRWVFENRIWRLEFTLPTDPKLRNVMSVKLTNLTNQLQLLGQNGRMELQLKERGKSEVIRYEIDREFVKAGETYPFTPKPKKNSYFAEAFDLESVEQVLDLTIVPVRQVVNVALGFRDERHFGGSVFPLVSKEENTEETPGTAPKSSNKNLPPGSPEAILDANKKRYIAKPTDQVRRMPVAIVLLIDQMFLQDALVAFANSPIRFQITQYSWSRYRGAELVSNLDDGSTKPLPNSGAKSGQSNSSLVELKIYGVVTLYNRFDPTKGGGGASRGDLTPPPPGPETREPDHPAERPRLPPPPPDDTTAPTSKKDVPAKKDDSSGTDETPAPRKKVKETTP